MSDTKNLAEKFVQRARSSIVSISRGPINSFDAMFSVNEHDLNEKENRTIEKLLVDGYEPGLFPEENVEKDIVQIKQITKELRSIDKQGLILIGERISKAKEIFSRYKEQSFREWLKFTYGSFKTGYNYIAFFDLYTALPHHLKGKFKEMPAKAAYVLASKEAPIEKKAEIVENHASGRAQDIITLIQETLGSSLLRKSYRKPLIDKILDSIEKEVSKLMRRKNEIDPGQLQRLIFLRQQLEELIGQL